MLLPCPLFHRRQLCSRCVRAGKFAFVRVRFLCFAFMACLPASLADAAVVHMKPVITGGRLPSPMVIEDVKTVDDAQFVKLGLTHKAICKFLFGRQRTFHNKVEGAKVFETLRGLRVDASPAQEQSAPCLTSVKPNGLLDLGLNAPTRKRKFSDTSVVEVKIGDMTFNILADDNRRRDVWMELTGANLDQLFSLVKQAESLATSVVDRDEALATSEDGASTTTASASSDEAKASPSPDEAKSSAAPDDNEASATPHEAASDDEADDKPVAAAECVFVGASWQANRRRWVLRYRLFGSTERPIERVFTPDRKAEKQDPAVAHAEAKLELDAWAAANLKPSAL